LALALQQRGIGVEDWKMWIGKVSAFSKLRNDVTHKILQYMLETQFLTNDEGTLWVGSKGEEEYGRKHFLELLSVFSSSPMFSILHGREELGFVDETTFLGSQGGSRTLLLGGRAWLVKHVDWRRRVAHVEETHADGTSSWRGQGTALGFVLCQAIKKLIEEESCPKCWSQRSVLRFAQIRKNLPWVQDSATTMVLKDNHEVEWWTFAGSNANGTFSHELGIFLGLPLSHDAFVVKMKAECSHGVERALEYLRSQDVSQLRPAVNEEALEGLKFSTCLPRDLATDLLRDRLSDKGAVENVIRQPVTFFRS
jgi:ATP-dependent Lhr-like helicase